MSFHTIRAAQQAVWPRVKESLDRHRQSRRAVEANPDLHTAAARARARIPWNHVVANETVWAIAKADLLNTPEQAAVLAAAKAWVRSWEVEGAPPNSQDDTPEDVALYGAVQEWASSVKIPDDIA
jgi:hypothetical protein